ncbi:spore coat protein U domain-containing protein [Taklimakanibacter lacteus]|uniref:spore coat protein U domain-containing protein n=1 Tax=Taklimakanibacter lacteus TaxID=2268456 RepID=UPI0034D4279F
MWLILLALMTVLTAGRADAMTCTASIGSPVVFSGIDILSGGPVDASSTLDVTCTVNTLDGAVGALLNITVCPNIGEGSGGSVSGTRQLVRSGGGTLNYNIYQDAARTVPWGHVSFPALGTVPPLTMSVTVPLLGTASTSTSQPVYFRLFGSQQASPPGTYTSSFAGSHTLIRAGIGLLGCPGLYLITSSPQAPFTVEATFAKNCTVTTQSVNFGTVGVLGANVDATGQVSVTCTQSTDYSAGLSVGSFTPTTRRMVKSGEFITYGLYRDVGRTQGWGDTAGTMPTGTGSGVTQSYTVYGRVAPQATPSAGTYSDTVVVTITY